MFIQLKVSNSDSNTVKHQTKRGPILPPLSLVMTTILDLGGVSGNTGLRRQSTQGVTGREGPIDVQDGDFRRGARVWERWKTLEVGLYRQRISCTICHQVIDTTVSLCEPLISLDDMKDHLNFALCSVPPTTPEIPPCLCTTHVQCLALHFLTLSSLQIPTLLPREGTCHSCHGALEWGEVMRSCYGRKAGLELEREKAEIWKQRNGGRARKQAMKKNVLISETEESGFDSAESASDAVGGRRPARISRPVRKGANPLTKEISSLILSNPEKWVRADKVTEVDPDLSADALGEQTSPSKSR